MKYGRLVANADHDQAALARELLDSVDAVAYLPEVELPTYLNAVDELLRAHRGSEQLPDEPSRARLLEATVGDRPVPDAVRTPYVLGLIEVFLTNGHGVAWNAEPSWYHDPNFGPREAEIALISFTNKAIASRLQQPLSQEKFKRLRDLIQPKLVRRYREIDRGVRASNAPLDKNGRRTRSNASSRRWGRRSSCQRQRQRPAVNRATSPLDLVHLGVAEAIASSLTTTAHLEPIE